MILKQSHPPITVVNAIKQMFDSSEMKNKVF